MIKRKLNKEEQEILKLYILEINKKGFSSDTRQQLIDLKITEIFVKRMLNEIQENREKIENALEEIKRVRKDK